MHTHENGTHDGAAHKSIYAAAPRENRRMQSNEYAMTMTFNPYFDSTPRRADKWIPRDTSEININDERELAYWCNELRIPIGDLIWLVEKYGTSVERIRALVR
jgi:hypothetical protein